MQIETTIDLKKHHKGAKGRLLYWEFAERVKRSMKWNMPSIAELKGKWKGRPVLICGGGPSIKNSLGTIREFQKQGGIVLTVNKTHDYLLSLAEPIIPTIHVLLDPMDWVANYTQKVRPDVYYLVASQCDPAVSRRIRLNGGKCWLWHSGADFYGESMPINILEKEFKHKPWGIVAGPTTVGLRSVILGYELGFRIFHLIGLDSSMSISKDGKTTHLHAYPKERPKDSEDGIVTLRTKAGAWQFYTNSHMAQQAVDFEELLEQIGAHMKAGRWDPVDLRVHGDGLIPTYAASMGLHIDPAQNMEFCGRPHG